MQTQELAHVHGEAERLAHIKSTHGKMKIHWLGLEQRTSLQLDTLLLFQKESAFVAAIAAAVAANTADADAVVIVLFCFCYFRR